MFGFGKGKRNDFQIPYPLIFKSAEAAIEYSSEYMVCTLKSGVALPAVVTDPRERLQTSKAVFENADGIQTAWLKVAGEGGGFECISQTAGRYGPRLSPGDMVFWQAYKHQESMADALGDPRSGWLGLIVGTLSPELNRDGWKGLAKFHE